MQGIRATRRARLLAVVIVGVVVALAGCATGSRDTASSGGAPAAPGRAPANVSGAGGQSEVATADRALAPGGEAAQGASFAVDALGAAPQQFGHFISTASMSVSVGDVSDTKRRAVAIAQGAGGQLFGEQTTFGSQAKAVLTLKVPPAKFSAVLDDLAALGTLDAQEVKTDDVTQQVVDLESRITAASSSLDRTRALLDKATNLIDIANLEREVSRRQADLENLRGQQKTLQDRIDLATVTLTLTGKDDKTPGAELAQQGSPPKPLPGFSDGLDGGLGVAKNVGTVALAAVGAALPFTPLLVVAYAVVRALRWRARRGAGSGTMRGTPAAPPTPAA